MFNMIYVCLFWWVSCSHSSYVASPPWNPSFRYLNSNSIAARYLLNTCLWWKYACTQWKINGSTSFAIDNMHYVNFRIQEQESVPWCDEFQNKDCKHLGILLIFTLIPLTPKMCGLSISNVNLFKRELESIQHSHTPFHASC